MMNEVVILGGRNMRVNEVKEMKQVVVKTEYIAVDGTVFTDKEQCEKWEKSFKCTLTKAMKQIPHVETFAEKAHIPCSNYDENVWVLKPRNFEDIKVINAYTEHCCGYNADLTQDDIGMLLALNFGYDYDWCDVLKIEKYLAEIKKAYNEFENEIDNNNK